jgi:hypothetical protein
LPVLWGDWAMPKNAEGFARAIHELRRNIETTLKDNSYYLAAHKLRELCEIAGPCVAALTGNRAAASIAPELEAKPQQQQPRPLPAPEEAPGGFGDALAALRASIKMEVWDDRYYEAVGMINALTELAAASGLRAPQARLVHPRHTVADGLHRARRAAAAELRGNAYYGIACQLQALTELLPQTPRKDVPAAPKTWVHPEKSDQGKPRTFDQLAAASARRVAQLAHPASRFGGGDRGQANSEDFERLSSKPCLMGERIR